MNIYDQLKAAGAQIDNHESDLYVKADDVSRPIIEAARTKGDPAAKNATTFRNQRPEERARFGTTSRSPTAHGGKRGSARGRLTFTRQPRLV